MRGMWRSGLSLLVMLVTLCGAISVQAEDWNTLLRHARGETVYFNAWGGSPRVNDYIGWAAAEVKSRYSINLKLVKVADTSAVVGRILAEKAAGREKQGSVDLLWVNGENFRTLKQNGLLFGPFSTSLPNYEWVDRSKPSVSHDFAIPVEGMESPWGMAQLVFLYDSARVEQPPHSMEALLAFAREHPGRVSYPLPPAFLGTTFLKQALLETMKRPMRLLQPYDEADFAEVTAPLWDYLDQLHPYLWHQGKDFPASAEVMNHMLDSGELLLSISFNPNEASAAILAGQLPGSVRTYVHDKGTLANTHFLAIPFNSNHKAAAQVVANFLLSPEAQARKEDPSFWGDPTVLDLKLLSAEDQARFQAIQHGPATLTAEEMGHVLAEPHASWVPALEQEWQRRYGH